MDDLRVALGDAEYTTDAVLDRIGELGQTGLRRNVTVPAADALGDDSDQQATLIRLWLLQDRVPAGQARAALPVDALLDRGYLETDGSKVWASIDIRPYGSPDDGASGWVVSDLQPGLDGGRPKPRPDYVLGVSPASTSLAQLTARTPVDSALDLGTGCGVQSLHLAQHVKRVVATDLNPRALELARLTLDLSGVDADLREGSLFEPVSERFDLIVSNPPFVMSPPEGERLVYRESMFTGDALVTTLLRQAADHLNPGGNLQLLTNWAVKDADWADRLDAAIPAHLDAWIVERERLDPYTYIEMWLEDAGLLGTPDWKDAYRRWLAYFDAQGIQEIGMGWIQLTNAERAQPSRVFESWPHKVSQPVGQVFADRADRVRLSGLPAGEFMARRFEIASDVVQETLGAPGAEDPEFIVLRQHVGLCRATKVDTAAAAVLGACDGELTLGELIDAVGRLLDQDVAQGVTQVARDAVLDGMLLATG